MGRAVGGGTVGYLALTYGADALDDEPEYYERLRDHVDRVSSINRDYAERTLRMYENHTSNSVRIRAENAIERATGGRKDVGYHYYQTAAEFQSASREMRNLVMSIPDVRRAVDRSILNGYSETYVDQEPGIPYEWRTDYRRFTNGTFQFSDEWDAEADPNCEDWSWQEHFGDVDFVPAATHREKLIFQHTQDVMRRLMAERNGLEPTGEPGDQF